MTNFTKLVPAQVYRVTSVAKLNYIVLEDFESSAGGGMYWSEFTVVA
jgi:hypothetical protein